MLKEKLTCIVMGMLRRGHYNFVDMYQREIISAIKAAVKQAVIEVVAGTEQSGDQSLDEQLKTLSVDEWTLLMSNTSRVLLNLLRRVKVFKTFNLICTFEAIKQKKKSDHFNYNSFSNYSRKVMKLC